MSVVKERTNATSLFTTHCRTSESLKTRRFDACTYTLYFILRYVRAVERHVSRIDPLGRRAVSVIIINRIRPHQIVISIANRHFVGIARVRAQEPLGLSRCVSVEYPRNDDDALSSSGCVRVVLLDRRPHYLQIPLFSLDLPYTCTNGFETFGGT